MGDFFGLIWGKILDFGDAVRDLVVNLISDFKESNRYFKVKVGPIVSYLLVCVCTAVVFIPPGELNEIGARLRLSKTEIVGGRYFLVVNESANTWKELEVTLNDRYRVTYPALRPGKKKGFFFNEFKDASGQRPAEEIRVDHLRIQCDEGAFERDFNKDR
jgi:hypothetical protein